MIRETNVPTMILEHGPELFETEEKKNCHGFQMT